MSEPSRSCEGSKMGMPARVAVTMVMGILPVLRGPVTAQSAPAPQAAVDSARVEAQARHAVDRYEATRRRHLPVDARWQESPCDQRVGRLCWRLNAATAWEPGGSPLVVLEARDSLLTLLARAESLEPGDAWIVGQRVRYLLAAGDVRAALAAAAGCGRGGPPGWQCDALSGLALHAAGFYPESETAFDSALAAMSPARRARWQDVSQLVDGTTDRLLKDAAARSPAARDSVLARMWHLADPLYLLPGNDRRTEDLARRTVAWIRSGAPSPYGFAWGSDVAELILRYGWELGWRRVAPAAEAPAPFSVVGFQSPDVRTFLPSGALVRAPLEVASKAVAPTMSRFARTGYAPAYAPVFLPMKSRLLVFTRGDRSLVAATYELPADTTERTRVGLRAGYRPPLALQDEPVRAGLFLDPMNGSPVQAGTGSGAPQGVLLLNTPAGAYRASVEVLDARTGRAGVRRDAFRIRRVAPDVPALSPLMLVRGDSLPRSTVAALRRMRLRNDVDAGRLLVVAWELWGLGAQEGQGTSLHYRLSLQPAKRSFFGRIGAAFGLARPSAVVEWDEPAPNGLGPTFRATTLALPAVDPGDYPLHLQVSAAGRSPLVREEQVHVIAAPGTRPSGGKP